MFVKILTTSNLMRLSRPWIFKDFNKCMKWSEFFLKDSDSRSRGLRILWCNQSTAQHWEPMELTAGLQQCRYATGLNDLPMTWKRSPVVGFVVAGTSYFARKIKSVYWHVEQFPNNDDSYRVSSYDFRFGVKFFVPYEETQIHVHKFIWKKLGLLM
jgi:hypothetical protein